MKFSDEEFRKNYINTNNGHKQKWVGMDSFNRFEKHKTVFPDNFSIKHYSENPIEYSLNNDFFRTPDDFNSNDIGNIYLGCSHTFGTGLYLEDIWAYKLNNIIGGKFWNLGVGGTGFMTAYRVFMHYIDKLQASNVFMYVQYPFRYEVYQDDRWQRLAGFTFGDNLMDPFSPLAKFLLNHRTAFIISTMVLKSITYECDKRGIDFYFHNLAPGRAISNEELSENKQRCGRDLIHMPTFYHDNLCETFLEMYKSKKVYKSQEKDVDIFGGTRKKHYI